MEEILFDITTLMSLNEYGEAYDRLSVIAAADEDNVMLQQMLMATALRAGRPELSRMWANRLPEGELTQPELLQAEYYLYGIDPRVPETQRLSNAEEMIARADTSDPDARRRARMLSLIVELRQARSAGNQPRVHDVIRRIGLLAQIPHEVRADAAQILKGAFNDHDAAVQLLRDRVTDESMDDNWMPHALLARTLVERWEGKLEDLRGRQRDALEAGQEVPVVEDPLMREDLAEAAEHLEIALEQLTAGSARPFLSRRLAEVTAYLEGLPSQRPAPEPMVLRNPQPAPGDDSPGSRPSNAPRACSPPIPPNAVWQACGC
jgi:hypothetical protein